jgi:uncharacterized membrane protein (UPF0127 family)
MENIKDLYIADSFFKRFMGYMFQKEPKYEAILIKPCNSIHTFFMRFNIDVFFVDEHMQVIKIVKNLSPGKVIFPVKGACAVVEVKAGTLDAILLKG